MNLDLRQIECADYGNHMPHCISEPLTWVYALLPDHQYGEAFHSINLEMLDSQALNENRDSQRMTTPLTNDGVPYSFFFHM